MSTSRTDSQLTTCSALREPWATPHEKTPVMTGSEPPMVVCLLVCKMPSAAAAPSTDVDLPTGDPALTPSSFLPVLFCHCARRADEGSGTTPSRPPPSPVQT